jgi:hypothetical protein
VATRAGGALEADAVGQVQYAPGEDVVAGVVIDARGVALLLRAVRSTGSVASHDGRAISALARILARASRFRFW